MDYVNRLLQEIEYKAEEYRDRYLVDSVFFGGGTPSVLPGEYIKEILCKLKRGFPFSDDCEITLEMNPGTVNDIKMAQYKEAGINRLSIGLQSTHDNELESLGRIHDYDDFLYTYDLARSLGFSNINVDLMSAIPGQTFDSLKETLEKVVSLNPEHISVYSLIIEEGTPFYESTPELPGEEKEREMYSFTGEYLAEMGYDRYEISNYAKSGKESRHNIKYWKFEEYLGVGLGASSLVSSANSVFPNLRFKNISDMDEYIQAPPGKEGFVEEELSSEDGMSEFSFMGLRMTEGISGKRFKELFKKDIFEVYGNVIEKHRENGLLVYDNHNIMLTNKGLDVANFVMCDFLPN